MARDSENKTIPRLPRKRRIVLFGTEWIVVVARSDAGVDWLYQWLAELTEASLDRIGFPVTALPTKALNGALRAMHAHAETVFTLQPGFHQARFPELVATRRPVNAVEVLRGLSTTLALLALTAWNAHFAHQRDLRSVLLVVSGLIDHPTIGVSAPAFRAHCESVLALPFHPLQEEVERRLATLAHPTTLRTRTLVPVRRPRTKKKPVSREM